MQIIGGKYRGKKLFHQSNDTVRPTIGRIRESIFNILASKINFDGIHVLDLFCGSGAYGLECYSRGAGEVVLVDLDTHIAKRNAEKMDYVTIKQGDFIHILDTLNQKFDLIFLDPPYDTNYGEIAINIIRQRKLLNENGIIVYETNRDYLCHPDRPKGVEGSSEANIQIKQYGKIKVYFLQN